MARIYIVEDDESIAELIAATLQAAGHQTHIAPDADHLAEALRTGVPQLLLLDLMLPGKDGLTLLREWKQASATQAVPVIILSAKGTELDKVRGLECGAEDYITKPFGVLEMQARVKTVLRRMKRSDTDDVQWGDLAFSFANKEVTQAGQPLQLTWKEYQLLECLCRHAGQTLSREQLLENVWGYRYEGDTTRTVDFHIAALRQKLGDQADRPRYIETVRGFGYRLKKDGTP